MSFVGFIIKKGKVKSDPAKIQAVAEWPNNLLKAAEKNLGEKIWGSPTFTATSSVITDYCSPHPTHLYQIPFFLDF